MSEYTTIKILKDTHRNLRILAALREESMLTLIDRLIKSDLEQLAFKEPEKVITPEGNGDRD